MTIADAADAIFVPSVGPGTSVIVREVFPRGSIGAVVLPHRAPGAFAEVGTPSFPVGSAAFGLAEALFFNGKSRFHGRQGLRPCYRRVRPESKAAMLRYESQKKTRAGSPPAPYRYPPIYGVMA